MGLIYDLIDSILESMGIPYYEGVQIFDGDEPEKYFSYQVDESPSQFSDNDFNNLECTVSLNLFSPGTEPELRKRVIEAFSENDFIYQFSQDMPPNGTFPFKRQRFFEFKTTLERG